MILDRSRKPNFEIEYTNNGTCIYIAISFIEILVCLAEKTQ